jgi:hypothetical protein
MSMWAELRRPKERTRAKGGQGAILLLGLRSAWFVGVREKVPMSPIRSLQGIFDGAM